MSAPIWSHPALARNRFYKEPRRNPNKKIGQCMPTTRSDYSPDEMEYEKRQDCEMQDEEELPF